MQPTVLFLPGATGAGDFWSPVVARLPGDWDTRLLSWPGAGHQPRAPEISGYGDLVNLAAAAAPDGCDVVAQSMGGVVAIGLALARPGKIRRLVLVATSGGLDVGALGGAEWRAGYRAEFPDAASWVTAEGPDFSSRLASLDLPVCLIWGDADPISPLAVGRALEVRLPTAALHVIAGGTHALAREYPDQVAALITDHLTAAPAKT